MEAVQKLVSPKKSVWLLFYLAALTYSQIISSPNIDDSMQNERRLGEKDAEEDYNSSSNASNYSNNILSDQGLFCEPMSCEFNCCSEKGTCPISKDECAFNICQDNMCNEEGCCIKGVCRKKSDCKWQQISRFLSIGILLGILTLLALFKRQIESFTKAHTLFSQEEEELHTLKKIIATQATKSLKFQSKNIIINPPILKNSGSALVPAEECDPYLSVRSQQVEIKKIKENPQVINNQQIERVVHEFPKGIADKYKSKFG